MNHVINEEGSRPIKIWTDTVEDAALTQLKNLARLPFIAGNGVVAMPDVHMGKGASVGTVIATDKAIIPAAVGVDIGCGMNAIRLSLKASDLPDSLLAIRHQIERDVPLGAGGARADRPAGMGSMSSALNDGCCYKKWFADLAQKRKTDGARVMKKASDQLGTLGSGNHFIEICVDESQDVWIMLHSGSRGVGNMIGSYFIERAKLRMEQYFISLPDGDLAYFPEDSDDFKEYVEAVSWAQDYALENRRVMMEVVVAALRRHITKEFTITQEAVNCHHNYVEKENHFGRNLWVTRKGAIRAREGDLGIIPAQWASAVSSCVEKVTLNRTAAARMAPAER
jgi:tRNA-splicing ligase RtcB